MSTPPNFLKGIIVFLGYFCFSDKNLSPEKQIYYNRLITRKTQKQITKEVGYLSQI